MPESGADLSRRIGAFAAEHRLQDALRQRWLALAPADAESLLALAGDLRLGENHLRDVLEWAEEIAVRDGTSVAAVLGSEAVRSARARDLGRNDAVKAVREALRRLRFPQLVALEERLARQVRALALPPDVRLALPPNLQDTEVRIEIRAGDLAALRRAVEGLRGAVDGPAMAELFQLLTEAP